MGRRRVLKPARCPSCGHRPIAVLRYGLPAYSEQLRSDLEGGRVVLAGCCVTDDDPTWTCTACGTDLWRDGRVEVRPRNS